MVIGNEPLRLTLIGYWSSATDDGWPNPSEFIDPTWNEDERDEVIDYLQRGFVSRAMMGYSPCRICGRNNGTLELTDGVYLWPDGLSHYLADHGVRPPAEFVTHVLERIEQLEDAVQDTSWWQDQR